MAVFGGGSMAAASIERLISQSSTYLRLLIKYRWPTAVATLSLTLLFTVIIAKIPNVYEATTTILVNAQHVSEKYVSPAVNSELYARLKRTPKQLLMQPEMPM